MENSQIQKFDNLLFPKLDTFFNRQQKLFYYLSLGLLVLFGILLFDTKISEGTDDSMYLLDAKKFMEGAAFPSFHGVFYIMMLGFIMKIAGFHLILFKSISLLFLLGHQIFLYLTLRNRISPFLLISILLIISLNSSILYFGSQTYTEAFFMFLQSLFFYLLIQHYSTFPNDFKHITTSWGKYLLMGSILFMLTTTRSVGISALLTLILFLIYEKKYRSLIFTLFSFGIFKLLYSVYKKLVWGVNSSDMGSQIAISLQKNPYNKALGNEDFSGMIVRFFENIKTYLSNLLLNIVHIRNENYVDKNLFISLIIIAILIVGFILAVKKKKNDLIPIYLYIGISLGITFISLSQMWGQTRLIIVFVPFIILSFLWPFYHLSQFKLFDLVRFIPIILVAFILGKEFIITSRKVHDNKKVLSKNLAGNKYYGYTPDLINYLKLSEWASKYIPENEKIGCRKASMSFIYSNGREFFPIFRLPTENVDSIISKANKSGKDVFYINEDKLFKFPINRILPFKKYLYSVIIYNTSLFGLYIVPNHENGQFINSLHDMGITEIYNNEEFNQQIPNNVNDLAASIPDNLITELKNNHVHYIISAELRYDVSAKTELTINTVERYMTIISVKYPGILEKIKQVGKTNDEPASLYKINFKKYNL